MNLTEKGLVAFGHARKHFPTGWFSAAELSAACGEKIAAATLNGIVSRGYMEKEAGTPVKFKFVDDIDNINVGTNINTKSGNSNLHKALKQKDDEFYTFYSDVKMECEHYKDFFCNKVVYLNCDSTESQFWNYFIDNFEALHLKKLLATSYTKEGHSTISSTLDGKNITTIPLSGNGDFSSDECISFLESADVVVTNPPFSLFRKLVQLLVNKNKYFLLVGNENTVASTEIFPLIKENKIKFGYNKIKTFLRPDGSTQDFGNVCWFTNLPLREKNTQLTFTKQYTEDLYPQYDNYEAINVDKVVDIPKNYFGIMGVPISYLNKHDAEHFEILGLAAGNTRANGLFYSVPYTPHADDRGGSAMISGKRKYSRVFIKRKDSK